MIASQPNLRHPVVFKDQPWYHLGFYKVMMLYNPAVLRLVTFTIAWSDNMPLASLKMLVLIVVIYFAGTSIDHLIYDLFTSCKGRFCVTPSRRSSGSDGDGKGRIILS
jgi:hypothetical protein